MNGQQKAEANFQAFEQWIEVQTPESYANITHRGKLKRGDITKACGFAKSALTQNPRIRERLETLEEDLRVQGVLPRLSEKGECEKADAPLYEAKSDKVMDSKRLASLEKENLELKAKLARLEELAQVIEEMGIHV
ncbi:hypothetical protein J3998_07235 [Thiomicrorhabdus sp. 6S2-11]|uniref:Transposase n=1 Tax=Thiomicrorhabdus marina TaxID=2818442 RepID=A0ABS3Q6A5_9GAMM|nr:VPA1267 family protein [Thiomicrorhabdus marina]MBO1927370.1 hypothetical protein [Thiomicrorhabdus marina]